MPLTDVQIRKALPKEKAYKLFDEKGLFLLVTPKGGKYWRFKYRFLNKEKSLAIGTYPEIKLKPARDKRNEARELLRENIDPSADKQAKKRGLLLATENSFTNLTHEWHTKFSSKWSPNHGKRILHQLEKDILPWLGNQPITEITAPVLLETLRRIENRGAVDTAHRILQNCSQIFRYAIATGKAERDICSDLRGALPPVKQSHHASITEPKAVGALLRAINEYQGSFITQCALKLAPLVFVRPGELRKAEWAEIDLERAEWRIPAEKMKMRKSHIVPLSKQAIEILNDLKSLTGQDNYLFPSVRSKTRPMSENTVNGALRRLGYTSEEMTGHGFRSMASTLLNENGWNRDAIERQLAHAERNSIRAAYNYAEHLPERKNMMQWWADYLDELGRTI